MQSFQANRVGARVLFWAVAATLGTAGIANADWGQLGGNAARTGYVGGALDAAPSAPLWEMNFNPIDGGEFNAPVAGDGRVFISKGISGLNGPQPDVRSFDLYTGQLRWQTAAPNAYSGDSTEATYANNKVYLHTIGHSYGYATLPATSPIIYSFDLRTGARTQLTQHAAQGQDTRVTVNDDFVFADTGYYGGTGGWALRSSTKWERTELDMSDTFMGDLNYNTRSTAADDGRVYLYRGYRQGAGSPSARLVAMNERTGALSLDYRIPGADISFGGSGGGGRAGITLGSQNNALIDYSLSSVDYVASISLGGSGSEQWRTSLGGGNDGYARSMAVANGVVYVQTTGAKIVALSETTGQPLWNWSLPKQYPADSLTGPMVVTDSHVLVTGSPYIGEKSIYAIDIASGQGGVYLAQESIRGLSDGILLTHNRNGSYTGGVLHAWRVSSRVSNDLAPLVDGRLRVSATPFTIDGEATAVAQDASGRDDALLEFDLGGFPIDARIESATLKLDTMLASGQLDQDSTLTILGYAGNGLLDTTDALGASTVLATVQGITGLDDLSVSLDTTYLQSLLGPNAVLGLRIEVTGSLNQFGFSATESDSPAPQLTVTYSVPEPAAASLLLAGPLAALARRRKR